jgi:hypothetical protein
MRRVTLDQLGGRVHESTQIRFRIFAIATRGHPSLGTSPAERFPHTTTTTTALWGEHWARTGAEQMVNGPFWVVTTANGVNVDFMDKEGEIITRHYAFLVSELKFDQILARVNEQGLTHWG